MALPNKNRKPFDKLAELYTKSNMFDELNIIPQRNAISTLENHNRIITQIGDGDHGIDQKDIDQVIAWNNYIIDKIKNKPKEFSDTFTNKTHKSKLLFTGRSSTKTHSHASKNIAAGPNMVPVVKEDGRIEFMRPPKEGKDE